MKQPTAGTGTLSARCPKCSELIRFDAYVSTDDWGHSAVAFEFWCEDADCNWNPTVRRPIHALLTCIVAANVLAEFNALGILNI